MSAAQLLLFLFLLVLGLLLALPRLLYWTQERIGEWLSHQPIPSFEDLDTGIVYEMEERDLPETVRRYRRIWP